jgi:phage terminase large subunit-like protein
LLHGKVRHGGHPLLNMAAANAIVVSDPSGNMKLDKSQSTQKIDPLQAMVMAVYAAASVENEVDISAWIA